MSRKKKKRMHQPLDKLIKRQGVYITDVFHEYHNFPGIYVSPLPNEFPNNESSRLRIDIGYYVKIDDKIFIIHNEDESKAVNRKTLLKCDNYKNLLENAFDAPVISSITTIAPIEKCERVLKKSITQELTPIIKSYVTPDAEKILSSIKNKIESGETLSKVEALELIMLPKRFTSGHKEVLNEVCHLLKILKIKDEKFKHELILEMDCIIHKYAETEYDIYDLEKVIGLAEVKTAMEYYEDSLIQNGITKGREQGIAQGREQGIKQGITQGREQGIKQGITQGRELGSFEMAIKIKHQFGLKTALEMSEFSAEELENEKLKKRQYL